MDSSPRQSHPNIGLHIRLSAMRGRVRTRVLRLSLVALTALALAFVASAIDLHHQGSVAAAPGDGTLKPDPTSKTIIQGYVFSVPTRLTTCANAASTQCQIGAYDQTLNFDSTRLSVELQGYTATSGTTTTITVSTAAWKLNQWVGSTVNITNGPGFGQKRRVASNTATTITVTPAFNPPPASQPGAGSIFHVGGMGDGTFLGSSGRTVSCLAPTYTASSAQLQCITLGSEIPGATGAGELGNVVFRAVNRGLASLSLTGVQILEIDGTPIPIDVFGGARRVILCPDPNGDGKVSSIDLSQLAQQFGKTTGDPGYTLTRDPNEDGQITSIDLSLTAQVFGLKCVQP